MSNELETTIAAAGSKATYTGAATTLGGVALSNELAVLVGIVLGFIGLLVNIYYKERRDRREHAESLERRRIEREEHEARMRGEL